MPKNWNLKNMKSPKKKKQRIETVSAKQPKYPYGLEVSLNKDSLQNLGEKAENFIVGKEIYILARAKISGVRITDSEDSYNRNVDLQITDMRLEKDAQGALVDGTKRTLRNNPCKIKK